MDSIVVAAETEEGCLVVEHRPSQGEGRLQEVPIVAVAAAGFVVGYRVVERRLMLGLLLMPGN